MRSHFQRLILSTVVAFMRASADALLADDLIRSQKSGGASFASTPSECDKEQNMKPAVKNVVKAVNNPRPFEQFDLESFFMSKAVASIGSKRSCKGSDILARTSCECGATPAPNKESNENGTQDPVEADITNEASQRKMHPV